MRGKAGAAWTVVGSIVGIGMFTLVQRVAGQTGTWKEVQVGDIRTMHEHLGQLIAYARTNHVVPPWSR